MSRSKTLDTCHIYLLVFLVLFFCIYGICGCSRKPAKSSPKSPSSAKKESKNLNKLQESIESVVKEFEKVFLAQTAPLPKGQKPEKKASGQEGKQGEQTGGKQSSQGGQKGSSQNKDGQKAQQGGQMQGQQLDWSKVEKSVTQIHTRWNNFQSEAVKAGANLEMTDLFSSKLNELTVTLTRQQLYEGLLASNDLYDTSISFESLFKTKSPPDARRVLYNLRDATYRALNAEEHEATKAAQNAIRLWDTVKPQLQDIAILNKVEYSLKEMEQAIKEKDPNLIKIKARIGETNLQDAIKEMEKQMQK